MSFPDLGTLPNPLTIQWQQNTTSCADAFTNIPGANGTSYDPGALTETTYFRVRSTNSGGCSSGTCESFSNCVAVTVNPLPIVDAGDYGPVCLDAAPINLIGTPTGGTFSGTGVTANVFNPANAGAGSFDITYSFTDGNGCTNTEITTIVVNPLPVLDAGDYGPVCLDAAPINLIGTPAGGTFSGTGVTANVFNPAVAGVGSFNITYSFTDSNGCTNSEITTIVVNPLPVVDAGD